MNLPGIVEAMFISRNGENYPSRIDSESASDDHGPFYCSHIGKGIPSFDEQIAYRFVEYLPCQLVVWWLEFSNEFSQQYW